MVTKREKRPYYWEGPLGAIEDKGMFFSENDERALKDMPKQAVCLYRENDSTDGLPFIMIYEMK